jgi:hypothetical protein
MHKLAGILQVSAELKPPAPIAADQLCAAVWEEAVGSRIARRTEPLRIERGVLKVRVTSAAWANELSLLGDDILAQLAARGVTVRALRFHVGPVSPKELRQKPVLRAAAPDARLPAKLRELTKAIADDSLRAALSAAAAKTLSMQRG